MLNLFEAAETLTGIDDPGGITIIHPAEPTQDCGECNERLKGVRMLDINAQLEDRDAGDEAEGLLLAACGLHAARLTQPAQPRGMRNSERKAATHHDHTRAHPPTPAAANHKAGRWNGPIETATDALHPTAHISECPAHRQCLDPPDSHET